MTKIHRVVRTHRRKMVPCQDDLRHELQQSKAY
nr:MAG TPA: hypothetical protein [Caudoviricetes sp.]